MYIIFKKYYSVNKNLICLPQSEPMPPNVLVNSGPNGDFAERFITKDIKSV